MNGISLKFEGEPIRVAPRTEALISVRVQPAGAYNVLFSLPSGGLTLGAALDRGEVVSGPDGRASVVLTTPNAPTSFQLRAQVGSQFTTTTISVEAGALTTLNVTPSYAGTRTIREWVASVYPATSCGDFKALPGDGPYLVRALAGNPLRLADVPAQAPLAVVARAGALAQGCTTVERPTANGETEVKVTASDLPLDLSQTSLDLVFGLETDDAAFKSELQAGKLLVEAALRGTAVNDVSAVLDAMAAGLPSQQSAAFSAARSEEDWDMTAPGALGRNSATRLSDAVTRWSRDAEGALLSSEAFQLRLSASSDPSVPNLTPQRVAGALADGIGVLATGLDWSVDPQDTLAFSATLSWPAASLSCALSAPPASAETGEVDLAAALASAFGCDALAVHLVNGASESAVEWASNCDVSCELALCQSAIRALVDNACSASARMPSTLSVLATGGAQVGMDATAASFEGSWVGRLTRGTLQSETHGALRGSRPRELR